MTFDRTGTRTIRFEKAKDAEPHRSMDVVLRPYADSAVLYEEASPRMSAVSAL